MDSWQGRRPRCRVLLSMRILDQLATCTVTWHLVVPRACKVVGFGMHGGAQMSRRPWACCRSLHGSISSTSPRDSTFASIPEEANTGKQKLTRCYLSKGLVRRDNRARGSKLRHQPVGHALWAALAGRDVFIWKGVQARLRSESASP